MRLSAGIETSESKEEELLHRKIVFLVAFLLSVAGGGVAVAGPPEGDPTCRANDNAPEECPGDNGEEGFDEVCEAPENFGTELASDILGPGFEGAEECPAAP